MSDLDIKRAILVARTKSLTVRKNQVIPGWNVVLPNGGNYHAKTDKDMVGFVKGY